MANQFRFEPFCFGKLTRDRLCYGLQTIFSDLLPGIIERQDKIHFLDLRAQEDDSAIIEKY